jgi:hypothetical protein
MKSRSRPRQWKRYSSDRGALYPWPEGAPLLTLKLPRIAGHGNRLQSGKRGQPSRRAADHRDQADVMKTLQVPWGLLHGGENGIGARHDPRGRSEVAGADELLEPEPCSGTVPSYGLDVPPRRISGHDQSGRSGCSPPRFMARVSNGVGTDMAL